jgi:hypothetical protein
MNSSTTFWGNYQQKMYSDEVKWYSKNTLIVQFNKVDVTLLNKICSEIENRYYVHKTDNHYQFIGKVISWNIIQMEKGFANLELVINQCPNQQSILFHTKNDVCSYLGISMIKTQDWMKKINIH